MNSNTERERQEHSLTLTSRKMLKITGVKQILNFDETNVSFVTIDGELDIDGEALNIDSLDLDRGVASVTGTVTGINYISDQPIRRRLFRFGS